MGGTIFKSTGTICPSSKWAARALANPLHEFSTPKRILEVGAGTGSVTVQILRDMNVHDELTVCELNPRFIKQLKKKLSKDFYYQVHKDRVDFFENAVQDMSGDRKFDVIVCGLPFNNFDRSTVDTIFTKLLAISHEKTLMTYFEYIGLRMLGKVMMPSEKKKRISEVESYLDLKYTPRCIHTERVWLNLLPIDIYTLKMAA